MAKERKLNLETPTNNNVWIKQEVAGCKFKDVRIGKRFQKLFENLWSNIGKSIPFACQDWASTKAASRFFSNGRVNEEDILSGHFQATKERFTEAQGNILVLHDTTEFTYKRDDPKQVGLISKLPKNEKNLFGKLLRITTKGILMHSNLAVNYQRSSIRFNCYQILDS